MEILRVALAFSLSFSLYSPLLEFFSLFHCVFNRLFTAKFFDLNQRTFYEEALCKWVKVHFNALFDEKTEQTIIKANAEIAKYLDAFDKLCDQNI